MKVDPVLTYSAFSLPLKSLNSLLCKQRVFQLLVQVKKKYMYFKPS